MVDIPKLIEMQREKNISERLMSLQILIASNQRTLDDKQYSDLVKAIAPQKKKNTFDREAFERLRSMSR